MRVVGNAFLRSMVRVVVGTLVEVGAGRREPGWVADALAACDRSAAGPTAPAQGLTFWRVEYPRRGLALSRGPVARGLDTPGRVCSLTHRRGAITM